MTASLTELKIGPSGPGLGVDELELKARVAEIPNRQPAVGLAVGGVRNGSLGSSTDTGCQTSQCDAGQYEERAYEERENSPERTLIAEQHECDGSNGAFSGSCFGRPHRQVNTPCAIRSAIKRGTTTTSAEWYRSHGRRRWRRAPIASKSFPLSLTTCCPAPNGIQ